MQNIFLDKFVYGVLVTLTVAMTPSVRAQEETAADVGRFLDEAAVAVVIVDLEELDIASLAELVAAAASEDRSSAMLANALLGYLQPAVSTLRELGAGRLFAVYSLHDVTQQMPYLIVPAANEEQAGHIAHYLETGRTPDANEARRSQIGLFPATFTRGAVAVVGSRGLNERLDPARVPDRAAGLSEALAVDAPGAVRVVSVLTDDQRRVLTEMLPALPEEFGGLSGEQIADGLKWISLGIDLQEGVIQGQIESGDEHSAAEFAERLPMLIAGIASSVFDEPTDEALRATLRAVQTRASSDRITVSTRRPTGVERAEFVASMLDRMAPALRNITIKNSLKQLALGMHNFHDVYSSFPPPASYDKAGKPLLSWRVYLLPFLEEGALYREFHLDEPWDSPHNRQLIERMPAVFASQHFDLNLEGKTTLQLPVGEQTPFHGSQGRAIRDISDGTSVTFMIVEVPRARAVVWTQPADFPVDEDTLKEAVFGSREQFWTAFCDGSARAIPATIPVETLRRLIAHQDGQVVGPF